MADEPFVQSASERIAWSRRQLLRFLAASPYVAASGGLAAFVRVAGAADAPSELLSDPMQALDVMDFELTARAHVNPGHWAYLASGVDDDGTLRANRAIFQHVQLRPRRLRDATLVDTRASLLGEHFDSPIFICPIGGQRSFNPDGELAVARAAKARGSAQCISIMTSTPSSEVSAALGRPVWQQLYAPDSWDVCMAMLQRIEAAGSSVLVLTVDNTTGRNSETFLRLRPKDTTQCMVCHAGANGPALSERPMWRGLDLAHVRVPNPAMDWAFFARLRKAWSGRLVIKGIDTREDAHLAVEHGVDAILVSNHGGRATETLRSTLEALPEVVAAARGKVPVMVDGGFRRGTDVFKALALGANGVGIGRPFMWGLGAFGEAGVNRVLEIMQGELRLVMGNCGTRTLHDITRDYIATPDWHA